MLITAPSLQAVEGFWVNSSGGNWNDAVNWTNTVTAPNGIGHIAWLLAPLSAERTILLQGDVTVGRLVLENDGYVLGSSIATSPKLVLDNNDSPAELVFVNQDTNRIASAKFRYPIVVTNRLDCQMVTAGNMSLYFESGFQGDANAVLNMTYQLTGGTQVIELSSNQSFLGTVNLRRQGSVSQTLGIRFNNAGAIFAGPAGSIRVHPGVTLTFRSAITDTEAARFAFLGVGQNIALESSGTLSSLSNPSAMVPLGGLLYLNHSSATVIQRYKSGASMPLNNTNVRLVGYNTAPGRVNEEFPGTIVIDGGNRISIENRDFADSVARMHFTGFQRNGNATLTLSGSGRGSPLGATVSNRVTVASGLPAETNGILPPWLVYYNQSQTTNGMFTRYGPNGLTLFDGYQATNSFALGQTAVVTQSDVIDLTGGQASCYALRSRNEIRNGNLTILSGGLILGSAFKNHTANLYFGATGTGNAYVHMDGHTDHAKEITISGAVHCQDFVKFGAQTDLRLTASNAIAGRVELQDGGLVAAHQYALGPNTDLEMGIGARFDLKNGGGSCRIGGLRSRGRATVQPNGTASENLVIHPAANTTNVFTGSLSNVGGTLSVTVAGTGRQVLNGVSTYTGSTVVSAGATLLLGDDGALGATAVNVAANGTFGGTGVTGGALSLADGAILKLIPGTPLRVASLATANPATVVIDVGENETLAEGVALTWSGSGPAEAPDLTLLGAPSLPSGAYKAEFDADNRQIRVVYAQHSATLILIR